MIPQRIIETSDLGFIFCGSGKLVKLNSTGNIVWQNDTFQSIQLIQSIQSINFTIGPINSFNNLCLTNDGIIYCNELTLAKFDNNGNILWQRNLGNNTSLINHIKTTIDGGIIAIGKSYVSIEKDFDAIMIKIDANGTIMWSKSFGGINSEDAQRVIQTKDGGFVFEGYTNSTELNPNGYGAWIVKTNELGDLKWQKTHGCLCYGNNYLLKNIEETSDLSLIHVVPSGSGYAIRKLSHDGDFQWEKIVKKTKWYVNYELFSYLALTNDNGFIVAELSEQESLVNGFSQPTSTQLKLVKLSYKQ
jgi:hypothetical protein